MSLQTSTLIKIYLFKAIINLSKLSGYAIKKEIKISNAAFIFKSFHRHLVQISRERKHLTLQVEIGCHIYCQSIISDQIVLINFASIMRASASYLWYKMCI